MPPIRAFCCSPVHAVVSCNNCSLLSPQRNPLAFPISHSYMYTPHMTLSISNRCRATLEKLLSTVPGRKTAPVYTLLPEIELALASGWTRKELWESLSSDGLEVSYKIGPARNPV